jgi:mono/diheme cytochrome c family protein
MSMKRHNEHFVLSVSILSRTLLVGGVLGLAAACTRHDAKQPDSTVASADTTVTTSTTAATPPAAPVVASVSTGETTASSDPKPAPTATPKPAAAEKSASTTHHATKPHTDSAASSSSASAATPASTTTLASNAPAASKADTGNTAAKPDTGANADHLLVSPQEYEGWKMFAVYCYRCHGVDAMGGGIAPNLRHSVSSEGSVTHDVFITTVTNGRLEKGMPTWKALLSPEQMEDLWLYINARSSGRLAPGRPHMAGGKNP